MCITCYKEYGSPRVINNKVLDAVQLMGVADDLDSLFYGYGHIVFDDWNVDDHHIDWCLDEASMDTIKHEDDEGKNATVDVLLAFRGLTFEERVTALALYDKIIN